MEVKAASPEMQNKREKNLNPFYTNLNSLATKINTRKRQKYRCGHLSENFSPMHKEMIEQRNVRLTKEEQNIISKLMHIFSYISDF